MISEIHGEVIGMKKEFKGISASYHIVQATNIAMNSYSTKKSTLQLTASKYIIANCSILSSYESKVILLARQQLQPQDPIGTCDFIEDCSTLELGVLEVNTKNFKLLVYSEG